MRVHDTNNESANDIFAADKYNEERGFFDKIKFWYWLMKGMNPKKIHTKLGLDGLGVKARDRKNFKDSPSIGENTTKETCYMQCHGAEMFDRWLH